MANAVSDCIVLVPVKGPIEPETQDALGALVERGYRVQILRDSSQIDLARSYLASAAMRKGFKETFWIDADVTFDPDDVEKIRAHGLPFTAALYVKKDASQFACRFKEGTTGLMLGQAGGLIEMSGVGMGFTHIRSEVYEAVAQMLPVCGGSYEGKDVVPYFVPMIAPNGQGFTYLSEDYSFCARALQAGFQIWADTSIKLGHIGRKKWTWDDLGAKSESTEGQGMSQPLYAKIGQLSCQLEEKTAHYQGACQILADVISGKVPTESVLVNLTDWTITTSNNGSALPMPGTVNGLPKCVAGIPMAPITDPVPTEEAA